MKSIKIILLVAFALTSVISGYAQKENISIKYNYTEEEYPKYQGEAYLLGNFGSNALIGAETVHGFMINKHVFVGAGTSINFNADDFFLPIFASFKYFYPLEGNITPFAYVDAGCEVLETTSFYAACGLGVKYRIFAFGLGWNLLNDSNNFSVKLGVIF